MPCLTWMLLQKPSKDYSPMPKYRKPQGRSVRPTFFVFCEGETEEEYVRFLRSHFRVPIEIDASVTDSVHDVTKRMFSGSFLRVDDFFDNLPLIVSEVG